MQLIPLIALMIITIASATENAASSPGLPKFTEIHAADLEGSTEGSSIIYDHIKLTGDLELNQAVYKSLKITNSIIEGNISAPGATFNEKIDFTNTSFCKNTSFFGATFGGEVDFSKSRFYGDANFSQSKFLEGATFDYNIFDNKASFSSSEFDKFGSFYDSTFKGKAAFDLAEFDGAYANFESAKFLKNAGFGAAQFNTYLSCSKARFTGNADFHVANFGFGSNFNNVTFLGSSRFDKAQFVRDTAIRNAYFNNTTDFSSVMFNGPSFFDNTQFHGNAIFSNAQFIAPSDFSEARFDKNLAMNSTEINTMVFDNATFNERSHLFLAKADINRFMVKWSLIKDILSYDSSAYLSLVKNYRDLGLDEADDCYYQYRFLSQESKSWSWSKAYDIVAEVTCGYGVRPDRPVTCSLILILFCAFVFFLGRGLKGHEHSDKKELFLDSIYYSLATFLEVHTEIKPAGKYRYISVFLKSLQWLLFALLVGTLTKVMIG